MSSSHAPITRRAHPVSEGNGRWMRPSFRIVHAHPVPPQMLPRNTDDAARIGGDSSMSGMACLEHLVKGLSMVANRLLAKILGWDAWNGRRSGSLRMTWNPCRPRMSRTNSSSVC